MYYRIMKEFLQKQETAFDICIKQLNSDLKKRYEDLAIFCEDVNITPKVYIYVKFIKLMHSISHTYLL